MKKIVMLFVATSLSLVIVFMSCTKSTHKSIKKIVVTNGESIVRAVYQNCGSKVELSILGEDNYKTEYVVEDATITSINSATNKFVVVPKNDAKNVLIQAFKGKKLVASEIISVRVVPSASVVMVGYENIITPVKMPTELSLRVIPDENFAMYLPKDAQYHITSFSVLHARDSVPLSKRNSDGNKVDLSGMVQKSQDGDRLVITNITAKRLNFKGDTTRRKTFHKVYSIKYYKINTKIPF